MKSFIRINKAGSLIHSFFRADNLHAVLTDAATAALPSNQGENLANAIKTQFDWLSSALRNVRLNL